MKLKEQCIEAAVKLCVGTDRPPDVAAPCGFHVRQAEDVINIIWPLIEERLNE